MLLYEFQILENFEKINKCAGSLYKKFEANTPSVELLRDAQNLDLFCEHLLDQLPKEVNKPKLQSHLGWLVGRLKEGKPDLCRSDIEDIYKHDLPNIENNFKTWCKKAAHYDRELHEKISKLLLRREYDSAIRKAFVILKERLTNKFKIPKDIDGPKLVNTIFGKSGKLITIIEPTECQAMRDLLAGLYAMFRNRVAHYDEEISWQETDAALSMINFILKRIETY